MALINAVILRNTNNTTTAIQIDDAATVNSVPLTISSIGNVSLTSTGAVKLPVGTTAQRPAPTTGMLRFNNTSTTFEGYNGTAWSSLSSVEIGDSVPATPSAGNLWWNSTTAQLYIYYNDGDSAQWVTAARGPAGPQGPLGPMGPAAILSDQTTSTATHYPTLTTVINGTATSLAVSSTKLTYQPSSGRLGATEMRATATTASSSTTTGALVVSGGAGVAGALYAGGAVRFTQNTASTSTTTGTLVVTGGIGLNGRLTASNIVANGATSTMRAINPQTTNTYDLGTTALRWRNIYTQDLHLSNGIGDYTVIEGEEDLFLVNNKNGKSYKFALVEVNSADVPPKSEAN